MKKIIGILLSTFCAVFIFGVTDVEAKTIYTKTVISQGHTYQVIDQPLTFKKAKEYCEQRGGHLVTITNKMEEKVIEKLIKKGKKNSYWLGAKKNSAGNFSKWITGEKMTYTNFSSGQPDNFRGAETALMIYRQDNPNSPGDNSYYWNDIKADGTCGGETFFGKKNFGLICEWDKEVYTITYFANKGTLHSNTKFTYSKGQSFTLKKPTRFGYIFKGWYEDAKFTNKVTKIKKSSKKNYVLYAKWEKK